MPVRSTRGGLSAQTLRGLVTDAITGAPAPLATVTLIDGGGERLGSVLTTQEGFYVLEPKSPGASSCVP